MTCDVPQCRYQLIKSRIHPGTAYKFHSRLWLVVVGDTLANLLVCLSHKLQGKKSAFCKGQRV